MRAMVLISYTQFRLSYKYYYGLSAKAVVLNAKRERNVELVIHE